MKNIIHSLHKGNQFIIVLFIKIASLIVAVGVPASSIHAQAKEASGVASVKSTTIHQEVNFNTSAQRLYETLLSTKDFSELSSMSSQVDATPLASLACAWIDEAG